MSDINWHQRLKETELKVRNFIDGQYLDCVGSETIRFGCGGMPIGLEGQKQSGYSYVSGVAGWFLIPNPIDKKVVMSLKGVKLFWIQSVKSMPLPPSR